MTFVPPWVPVADRPAPEPAPRPAVQAAPRATAGGSAYAIEALAREADTVATAPQGTRNDTLNRAAFSVGQLIAGGELNAETAWDALFTAARKAGLGDAETGKTISSGFRSGAQSPRTTPPRAGVDIGRLAAFVADGPADRIGGRLVWACRQVAGLPDRDARIRTLVRAAIGRGMPLDDAARAAARGLHSGRTPARGQ